MALAVITIRIGQAGAYFVVDAMGKVVVAILTEACSSTFTLFPSESNGTIAKVCFVILLDACVCAKTKGKSVMVGLSDCCHNIATYKWLHSDTDSSSMDRQGIGKFSPRILVSIGTSTS